MIAVLICWITIVISSLGWGEVMAVLYNRITREKCCLSIFESFTLGICVLGSVVCLTSLFIPSGMVAMLVLMIIPLLMLVVMKEHTALVTKIKNSWNSVNRWQFAFSVIAVFIFLLFTIVPPQFPDTFIYHIQNMMWNEEYRVVPGVASLQHRFGFNSNLLLLSSLFGLKPLFGQFIFGVNSLYMASLLIFIIKRLPNWTPIQIIVSLTVFVAMFVQYTLHIGSPSTDLLPNLMIVSLFLILLDSGGIISGRSLLFWIVPVFCLTLKLSIAPICILCIFILWQSVRDKHYRKIVFFITAALIILLPWLARNVIISGYLIFPFPAIDWFSVDWKQPLEIATTEKNYIKAYAISIDAMGGNIDTVLSWPLGLKLQKWMSGISRFEIGMLILLLLSPAMTMIAYIRDRRNKSGYGSFLYLIWITAFVGTVFCFYQAPAFRFSFGFVAVSAFAPYYFLFRNLDLGKYRNYLNYALTCICLLALLTYSVRYYKSIKSPEVSILQIVYKPQSTDYSLFKDEQRIEHTQIGNLPIGIATQGVCIDCSLPCMQPSGRVVQPRGNAIEDGFRIVE